MLKLYTEYFCKISGKVLIKLNKKVIPCHCEYCLIRFVKFYNMQDVLMQTSIKKVQGHLKG